MSVLNLSSSTGAKAELPRDAAEHTCQVTQKPKRSLLEMPPSTLVKQVTIILVKSR